MASRGLAVSKKQCCDILGWTSSEVDRAVREGMPVAERPSGRGTDWVVFMVLAALAPPETDADRAP